MKLKHCLSLLAMTTALGLFGQDTRPPVELVRYPRVSLSWSWDPTSGLGMGPMYGFYLEEGREVEPDAEHKGETIRAHFDRHAMALPLSAPAPEDDWYVDIIPAKGEGYRLKGYLTGGISGSDVVLGRVLVPENAEIKAIRVYRKGAFAGEALNLTLGQEASISFAFENGTVTWKVQGPTEVKRLFISTNKGKTWHPLLGRDPLWNSGSKKVDFGTSTEAILCLECTRVGNFFRKEIVIRKGP